MDGCSFRIAFKSAFNLATKVLAYSNEKWYTLAVWQWILYDLV